MGAPAPSHRLFIVFSPPGPQGSQGSPGTPGECLKLQENIKQMWVPGLPRDENKNDSNFVFAREFFLGTTFLLTSCSWSPSLHGLNVKNDSWDAQNLSP